LKKLVEYKLMMTIIKTRIVVLSTTAYWFALLCSRYSAKYVTWHFLILKTRR
jgi:hypothetical protein